MAQDLEGTAILASAGARLVVSDMADKNGEATVGAVRIAGGEAAYARADLASEDAVRRQVEEPVACHGRFDRAFNNAGLEPPFAGMFDRPRARHPIGRFGEPSGIGEAVRWLLSDASSVVNGAAIPVDGGCLSI